MVMSNRKPARTADVNHPLAARPRVTAPVVEDAPSETAPVGTAPVVEDAPSETAPVVTAPVVEDAPSETAIVIAALARVATAARLGAGRTTIVAPDAQRVIGHPDACKNGNRPNRM